MADSKLSSSDNTGDKHEPSYVLDKQCETDNENEVRIVLVGRTGSGMSATGNSILGQTTFVSDSSGSSITNKCCIGTTTQNEKTVKHVKVVDTPGLFGNCLTIEEIRQEVLNCFYLTKPGPHAILYILRIGRFTNEEIQGIKRFLEIFGGNPLLYTVIVLTGVDDLEWNQSSNEEYLKNAPFTLKKLINDCSGGCVFFNNRLSNPEKPNIQLGNLFMKLDKMLKDNKDGGKPYYTNDIIPNIRYDELVCAANKHDEAKCRSSNLSLVAGGVECAANKHDEAKCRSSNLSLVAGGAGAVIATTGGVVLFGMQSLLVLPFVGVGAKMLYNTYKDSNQPNDKLSKVLEEIKEDSVIQCTIS